MRVIEAHVEIERKGRRRNEVQNISINGSHRDHASDERDFRYIFR